MPSINLGRVRGDKGTSMRNRDAWNAVSIYTNDKDYIDLVTHNGSLWTCLVTNTNVEPSDTAEEWNLTAKSVDTVYFDQANERENISSGDPASTAFGKISKWFADLKAAAFYNVVNSVTQSEPGQAVLDAAVGKYLDEKKIDISKIVKSIVITEEGFLMDGKTASEAIAELGANKTGFPDFSNVKNLSGNPITMDEDGYVRLMHRASVAHVSTIQVNGVLANRTYMPSGSSFGCTTPLIPVRAGDIVNITTDTASTGGQNYQTNVYFIPLIKEGKDDEN